MKSFFIPQEPGGDYATLQIKTKIANDFFKDEIKGVVKDDFFETLHPRIMMETFIYLWENNKLEKDLCAFWFYVMYYRVSTELPYMCHPAQAEPYWDTLYEEERIVRIYLFSNAQKGAEILKNAIEYVKVRLAPFYNVKDNPAIQEELKEDFAKFPKWTIQKMQEIYQNCLHFENSKIKYKNEPPQKIPPEQKDLNLCNAVITGDIKTVETLLEQGASPNTKNNFGQNLLMLAANNDRNDILKLLIKKGAQLNAKDFMGNTCLILAVKKNNLQALSALIDAKADINIKNNSGNNALLEAIRQGFWQTAQELIFNGADINQKDLFGRTPLMKCLSVSKSEIESGIAKGKSEIAKVLINFGADVLAKDTSGNTALGLALRIQNQELALMLANAERQQQNKK